MTQIPGIQRKLTTILAADAANFSGRMQLDEIATVQALRRSREIFESRIQSRGGRIANTAGDGLIAEFPSVVEAVAAAVSIQRELESGKDLLPFRIGLHLGDVIVDGQDLLGDGVNLAARLQDMAREGGILATRQVVDHAKGRLSAEFRPLGLAKPKNFHDDVEVFAIVADGVAAPVRIQDVAPQYHFAPDARPAALTLRADKYSRSRTRNRFLMAGMALLDIVTGNGFGWCIFPIAVLFGLTARGWYGLNDSEKAAIRAAKRTPASK
ncbi:MAG: adenylate/guanylate cyclase domain-containing protein [Paracoccaceae bacterium]